jgi:hypothetical protein
MQGWDLYPAEKTSFIKGREERYPPTRSSTSFRGSAATEESLHFLIDSRTGHKAIKKLILTMWREKNIHTRAGLISCRKNLPYS